MIQVFKPWYGQEELDAVREVLESGWLGLGPKTAQFEERFAAYVGAKYAVGLNSATAALHLACLALDIGPGDEVLVPTITFVSTAHAVSYCGATPVFVDIDPQTLNVDLDDLRARITPRTRAIIVVHYGGHACSMEDIWKVAEDHGIPVIEDAAHACGTTYDGQRVGGLGRTVMTCFSFQAVKNLAVGDGGMVTTNRVDLWQTLRRLRWVGIDKSTWDRTEEATMELESDIRRYASYGWYYEVHDLGFKYHMNDISAALGLAQLEKLERGNERRRAVAARYNQGFAGVDWLTTPVELPYTRSATHNYVIQTDLRDEINLGLKERDIATGVHYMPLHLQPYYRKRSHTSLPVAESVWTRLLTLPLYPGLTDEEADLVVDAVRTVGDESEARK